MKKKTTGYFLRHWPEFVLVAREKSGIFFYEADVATLDMC